MSTGWIGGGSTPASGVTAAPRSTVTAASLQAARSVANPATAPGPAAQAKQVRLTRLENPQQGGETIKPTLLGR